MLGSTLIKSPASSSGVLARFPSMTGGRRFTVVRCLRDYSSIPKMKSWQPTLLDKFKAQQSFVEKTKENLSEYCTKLEGEECCSCWEAHFELQALEIRWPEEEFKKFLETHSEDNMRSLINWIHHYTLLEIEKLSQIDEPETEVESSRKIEVQKTEPPRHIPDGILMPETIKEIEAEERMKMEESYWTRFLRGMHIYPSWYVERPDVEYN